MQRIETTRKWREERKANIIKRINSCQEKDSNWLYIQLNCSGHRVDANRDIRAEVVRCAGKSQRGRRDKAYRPKKCLCVWHRRTPHREARAGDRIWQGSSTEMRHQEQWFCKKASSGRKMCVFQSLSHLKSIYLPSLYWPDDSAITLLPIMPHMWAGERQTQ